MAVTSAKHDYPGLCRSLAAWLLGESKGEHRELKRRETADRLLEIASLLSETQQGDTAHLVERIHQFDAAIRRIAHHVGAVCGGVDTGPLGGHTADEIIRCIDVLRSNGGTAEGAGGVEAVGSAAVAL